MTMPAVIASDLLAGASLTRRSGARLEWQGETIAAVSTADAPQDRRLLVLPAFANAHDHARPLAMSSFGAAFMPLETWLLRSALATPPDPYLAACAPLARAAQSGCAAVMVHYTRPSGTRPLVDEANEFARAAGDVRVRIAFALALRDRNPLVYGDETGLVAALPAEARAAVGMDGLAFDEDDDMLREMRLTHAVHAGLGFEPTYDRHEFLASTIAAGRRAIGAPSSGALEPGAPADFIAIDLDRLDRDAIMPVDPVDLLFARGTAAHLERLVVAGRTIVDDGRVTGIDLPAVENELRERYRRGRDRFDGLEAAWPQLENAIQHWFADRGAACC
jgi:cytosine/adenosine deaminase-related metal-dependent hydrolase